MIDGRHLTPQELRWMGALAQSAQLRPEQAEAVFKTLHKNPALRAELTAICETGTHSAEAAKPALLAPTAGA